MLICFFILLNALLAIIVESYDRTKREAELEKAMMGSDALVVRQLCGGSSRDLGVHQDVAIEADLLLKL